MSEVAKTTKKLDFTTVSLLFFLISFLGWGFETVVCYVETGRFCDRGFLTLPFCPIYGGAVCLIYLAFGRPSDGLFYRILQRKKSKRRGQVRDFTKFWSVCLYYLTATIVATLIELIVGMIVEAAGVSLWSYHGLPFCFMDLICLPVSLVWGALVSLFTQYPLPWFAYVFKKIPKTPKNLLTCSLWTAVTADYLYNVALRFLQ